MSVIVRQRGPNGDCFGAYAKGSPEMIKSLSQEATSKYADFDSMQLVSFFFILNIIALTSVHQSLVNEQIWFINVLF